jgi:hypothetical protein
MGVFGIIIETEIAIRPWLLYTLVAAEFSAGMQYIQLLQGAVP